jgi:hypothetical protein
MVDRAHSQTAAPEIRKRRGEPHRTDSAELRVSTDPANSPIARWLRRGARAARPLCVRLTNRQFWRETPAWLTSTIFHALLLVMLGLWMMPDLQATVREIVATTIGEERSELEQLEVNEPLDPLVVEQPSSELSDTVLTSELFSSIAPTAVQEAPAALSISRDDFGIELAQPSDLLENAGIFSGRGLEGRGETARKILVAQRGGTVASEAAVARSLNWLVEHQQPDGGWSFDHRTCPSCQGACPDAGLLRGRIAPTALALLPFLGAGHTHQRGKYARQVQAGLEFLVNTIKFTPDGADLMDDGRLYSHGIATIALCEAYALSQDQSLLGPAQQALNFTVHAQDKLGGGWRYEPGQPGDTSALGWQLMALKSAHMAYLTFPPETIEAAGRFLDGVASNDGANYGYTDRQPRAGTTAVGLLCRMYLGWQREHPPLARGVKFLSDHGPSRGDFYFNYYATQVLAHFEGELWEKWNKQMRDYLVDSQVKEGHAAGSWYMPDDHGSKPAGRLYMTAMACMTLEVYYRHLPLYREEAARSEFTPHARRSR